MSHAKAEYSLAEEIVHAASHGVGVLLSLAGLSWMLYVSLDTGDPWRIVASCVYGASLICLFLASTLYHAWPVSPRKNLFKLLDHCAIYLLIAGTYTPLLMVTLDGDLRLWMLTGIWVLAVTGVLLDTVHRGGRRLLQLLIYVVMGWLCVFAWEEITAPLSSTGFSLLAGGGILYTSGIVFYLLDERYPWCHGVWHLFVIGGSLCHFFTILFL